MTSFSIPKSAAVAAVLAAALSPTLAADAPKGGPVAELGDYKPAPRKLSLPAHGLFEGDQLSENTKVKLTELVLNAKGLQVNATLVIPNGPWRIDVETAVVQWRIVANT